MNAAQLKKVWDQETKKLHEALAKVEATIPDEYEHRRAQEAFDRQAGRIELITELHKAAVEEETQTKSQPRRRATKAVL